MKKPNSREVIIGITGGLVFLAAIGGIAVTSKKKTYSTTTSTTIQSTTTSTTTLSIGALNPVVTQSTIKSTICVVGWTATIRPSSSYSRALKIQQLAALGYADQNPSDYEEDHIIPLELGGAPKDPKNLRPEIWAKARIKDADENRLHAAVCSGALTLDAARQEMLRYALAENPA